MIHIARAKICVDMQTLNIVEQRCHYFCEDGIHYFNHVSDEIWKDIEDANISLGYLRHTGRVARWFKVEVRYV